MVKQATVVDDKVPEKRIPAQHLDDSHFVGQVVGNASGQRSQNSRASMQMVVGIEVY